MNGPVGYFFLLHIKLLTLSVNYCAKEEDERIATRGKKDSINWQRYLERAFFRCKVPRIVCLEF